LLFAIYVDDLASSCNSTRGIYIVLYVMKKTMNDTYSELVN